MPVNPVVPNTIKIAVEQTIGTAELVNTFYVEGAGTLTPAIGAAIAGTVSVAWGNLLGDLSTAWTLDQTVSTDLSIIGGSQVVVANGLVGTDATNPLPYQSAAGVTWYTARVGRAFRGRTYLGGFCEDGSNGQGIDAGVLAAINGWAADMMSNLNGLGSMVVVSRFELNPTPPPSSIPRVTNITTPITSHAQPVKWHTQRRRAQA